jgi:prevent-host-death family protein
MQIQNVKHLIKNKFIGTDDLRKDLSKILENLDEGEIVVTQHGKPQAVLLDIEEYIDLQEQLADANNPTLIKEINEAIEDVEKGHGIPAQKVFDELGI